MPTTRNMIRIVNLEKGMPTVEQARRKLIDEIETAKRAGARAIKVIHGYGSTGVGGKLQTAIRLSLVKHRNKGLIKACIFGEKWDIFDPETIKVLDVFDELRNDKDLQNCNEGITIVLL
jgi:hypothetical protein